MLPDGGEMGNNTGAENNARKTVLIVDDNTVLLRTVKDMLAERYDINIAVSGTQAFMAMQKKMPDIILLDYDMPYNDGGQVLARIRNHPQTMHIPVVFFTSSAEREIVEKLVQLKPDGYILKPPSKEKLIKIIEKTLGLDQEEQEEQEEPQNTEEEKEKNEK